MSARPPFVEIFSRGNQSTAPLFQDLDAYSTYTADKHGKFKHVVALFSFFFVSQTNASSPKSLSYSLLIPIVVVTRYVTVAAGATGKILFVVPTEPLVWQVAALFNKLLRGQVRRSRSLLCLMHAEERPDLDPREAK